MSLSFEESKKKYMKTSSSAAMPAVAMQDEAVGLNDDADVSVDTFTKDDKYMWCEDYHDDKVSTIDESKNIKLDSSQINLTQEDNSQYIPFEMPRYYDGIDLTEMQIRVHYVNKNDEENYATPINMEYSDTTIRFGWLVDKMVTNLDGLVRFEIVGTGSTKYGMNYEWKSRPNGTLNILQSLTGTGVIGLTPDWYTNFITYTDDKVREITAQADKAVSAAGNASDEANAAEQSANKAASHASAAANSADSARSSRDAAVASKEAAAASVEEAKKYAAEAQQVSQGAMGWFQTSEALKAAHPTGSNGQWAVVGASNTIWVWDSEQSAWIDSGLDNKLADYYTKSEVDAMFKTFIQDIKITIPASSWESGSYETEWGDGTIDTYAYLNTVVMDGMTENSRVRISEKTCPTDDVRKLAATEVGNGVVKFYTDSEITKDITVILEKIGK